jgi:acetylglutamate kinase
MLPPFEQAQTIAEILPYLQKHRGATVVIKYGGAAMTNPQIRMSVLKDVVLLRLVGLNPILVHGGGPEINAMVDRLGMPTERVDGYRITDAATMEVVEMVLSGSTNKAIVRDINVIGGNAIGISGKDGHLLMAAPFRPNGKDIGFVGEVEMVRPQIIRDLVEAGYLPVIAPIGIDCQGQSYNLNADTAAAAIAGALDADKFIMLTDVPGVLLEVEHPESLVSTLTASDANTLIETGKITGGMIPKIAACLDAIERGVARCHIIDGRQPHAMLVELFTVGGIGTMVVPDEATAEAIPEMPHPAGAYCGDPQPPQEA